MVCVCECVCCSKLDLPRPTAAELAFLSEYISAMKPLAKALNIIQQRIRCSWGYLLSTVANLRYINVGRHKTGIRLSVHIRTYSKKQAFILTY